MKLAVRINHTEEGRFVAVCPSLPGCKTYGQTREEAQQRINEAIKGYIAAMSDFVPENVEHEVVEV
jgi:predicted RNase H-like HicB family nuclease